MDKQDILSRLDIRAYYAGELSTLKANGNNQAQALCPFHEDKNPSLSINLETGDFHCFGCDKKGSIFDFFMARHGVDFSAAKQALAEKAGLISETRTIKAEYDYKDEAGNLLFQAVRYQPKDFKQRRPDGKDGWIYNLQGVRLVPFNLPEVLKAKSVIICEGEKDCLNLKALGLTVTCNAMGAGKWRPEYNEHFRGKRIAILPDNDKPGREHAHQVAQALKGLAENVKVVELPDLPVKGDVSDWIAQGGTKEALLDLIKMAPEWEPPKEKISGFALTRLGDLLKESDESVSWLVSDMLPAGGFSVLAAKPKTGKSTLARNLALCVPKAVPFLGKETVKGPVLYLALEEKKSEIKRHFRDMGADGTEEIYIFAGSVPQEALKELRTATERHKPALVIIDPLFRLARVKDGNDYVQVTQALEPLLMLARETGTHVLCVHHTGKGDRAGGDAVLGSTAIFSSVDTLLIMKRHDDCRTLTSIQRYGEDLAETTLHFDKDSRVITLGQGKQEEDLTRIENAVVDFLREQAEPVTEPLIMDEVEGRQALKRKALRQLVINQKVSRDGKGGKGDPFKYSCTLVPDIYRGTRVQETGNGGKPNTVAKNACTQSFDKSREDEKSRVQESRPEMGAGEDSEITEDDLL